MKPSQQDIVSTLNTKSFPMEILSYREDEIIFDKDDKALVPCLVTDGLGNYPVCVAIWWEYDDGCFFIMAEM